MIGLAWQQGPLTVNAVGHFLTPEPTPARLLFAEPLRRRMRVRADYACFADFRDPDGNGWVLQDGNS